MNINDFKNKVGKNIKEYRSRDTYNKGHKREKMNRSELARKSGITYRSLVRIEEGEVAPGGYTLYMIAKTLEIPLDYLIR